MYRLPLVAERPKRPCVNTYRMKDGAHLVVAHHTFKGRPQPASFSFGHDNPEELDPKELIANLCKRADEKLAQADKITFANFVGYTIARVCARGPHTDGTKLTPRLELLSSTILTRELNAFRVEPTMNDLGERGVISDEFGIGRARTNSEFMDINPFVYLLGTAKEQARFPGLAVKSSAVWGRGGMPTYAAVYQDAEGAYVQQLLETGLVE